MAQHHDPFCYSAVPLGEAEEGSRPFRVMELLPSNKGDALSCRIYVDTIEQSSQSFKTLSYAWGKGPKSHLIRVVSADVEARRPAALPITETLHTCLVQLRHARKPLRLWVDQICINQEDHVEKGKQVRLMGPIYTTAAQVLVWLGPAGQGSDSLMDAWQHVGQAARDWGIESYYTRDRWHLLSPIVRNEEPSSPRTVEFQALLREAAEIFAPLVAAEALKHWFAQSWFTRAWVVQEFCLCPDTVFVCGTKSVRVELVMLAIQMLQYSIPEFLHTVYTAAGVPLALLGAASEEPTARLFSCRQRRRKFDRGEPDATGDQLHALLRKLYVERETQAAQHCDRIFSLLGLAVDAVPLGIVPDYTDPSPAGAVRILTAAARAMITNPATGRIDVLCFAQSPKNPSLVAANLPSWVPDWRSNLRRSFYTITETVDTHLFAACGPLHTSPQPLPSPNNNNNNNNSILGLRGYRIDTIEATAPGEAWTNMDWDAARFLSFFTQVDGLFERAIAKPTLPQFYKTEQRRAEARWRVPIGDLYWTAASQMQRASSSVAGGEAEVGYGQCVESLRVLVECMGLVGEEQERRMEEWDWHGRHARGEVGGDYRESMKYMVGKRPFVTGEGYLGMGPAEAAEGDVVVVFCGGRIPFVLRPREGGEGVFEFVGEAYCDGVMDGEAAEAGELSEFFMV